MGKITWLASYPKSGNTWLRILLANHRSNSSVPADINRLDGGAIAGARTWFDEWAGIEASALSDRLIERLRPDVYRCLARETPDDLVIKVHDAWALTDRGEPLFPSDVTARVLYIVRNPLDVAGSMANHMGVSVGEAVQSLCDSNFTRGSSVDRLDEQLPQFIGSWSHHVHSWVDLSGLHVHVVRYEDLRREPERVFGDIVRVCGLADDGPRLRRAVAFSDFDEVQRQERENGFCERLPLSTGPFFRRGEVGAWRDELSPQMTARLIEVHGATMRRFGYLDEEARPI